MRRFRMLLFSELRASFNMFRWVFLGMMILVVWKMTEQGRFLSLPDILLMVLPSVVVPFILWRSFTREQDEGTGHMTFSLPVPRLLQSGVRIAVVLGMGAVVSLSNPLSYQTSRIINLLKTGDLGVWYAQAFFRQWSEAFSSMLMLSGIAFLAAALTFVTRRRRIVIITAVALFIVTTKIFDHPIPHDINLIVYFAAMYIVGLFLFDRYAEV